MAKVLSSISGNLISAASAGYAPTNSSDVSAIASSYQVVSATGTQLYASTAHVTSINNAPISASRAGNAANAALATSAYYDGTGRLISSLPDSATVSAIASAYAESAVSGKQDELTFAYDADSAISSINGSALAGGGDYVEKSSTEVTIGDSNTALYDAFAQGTNNSAKSASLAQGLNNTAKTYSIACGKQNSAFSYSVTFGTGNSADMKAWACGERNYASSISLAVGSHNSAFVESFAFGSFNRADRLAFVYGDYISAKNNCIVFGCHNKCGDGSTASGDSAAFVIGDGPGEGSAPRHDLMLITKDGEITMYSSTADTTGTGILSSIRAISAAATGGVDSATVSAIASAYASSKQDSSAMSSYALSADVSSTISTVSTNSASWASTIETASATAYKQNGTQLVAFTGVASADSKPLIAQTIQAGAVQSIGTSNFFYGPSAKPFTANTAGIYAPLQYATGACLAMDGGTYRAYYKGNEWFISDYGSDRSGAVRAEVHSVRGIHISGCNTAGVGFDLLTTGLKFKDNTGTTSMTPANIAEWQSCNSTVSSNSATWASASSISSYALSADVSGCIDTVSSNSASWGGGGATGDYVEKSALNTNIGKTATNNVFAVGMAHGMYSTASNRGYAFGSACLANGDSFACGFGNSAEWDSFALGSTISTFNDSFAAGFNLSATDTAVVFGRYNLQGNGNITADSAAFVIGDGTATGARHDLMKVTKDGEITMYSSTADTAGLGLVSAITALSATVSGVTALLDAI